MPKNDRKFEILYAIIKDYIRTAEPVGSRAIEKKHNLGISSATIRNEMADLEEMGLLIQPHASSGRIPSEKAYRLYVDQFLSEPQAEQEVSVEIASQLEVYMGELTEAVKKAAEILSKITSYTAIVSTPSLASMGIKDLRVVPIKDERVFVLIITKQGTVKNAEMRLSFSPSAAELERVGNFLGMSLVDSEGEALLRGFGASINELGPAEQRVIGEIVPAINTILNSDMKTRVYADGITEIMNYPEFQDVNKVKMFFETMHKQELLAMLMESSMSGPLDIKIGTESEVDELADCSILTATYKLDGRPLGTIGIVGPTRMDYEKGLSALSSLTNELTKQLNQGKGGADDDG
jgi:heat-inducible transcriptional repressor